MKNEVWKKISRGYEVSDLGRIRSFRPKNGRGKLLDKPRLLKPIIFKSGYSFVNIDGKCRKISRLVAQAFLGKSKLQVNHLNGIKTDNRLINLEYCTASQNIIHAYETGLSHGRKGEKHHRNKLTEKQAIEIKYKETGRQIDIAKKYNVTRTAISLIKRNITWGHI